MYDFIRKIHLYTGMVLLTFIVMYFLSGYAILHRDWLPEGTRLETVRAEPLVYAGEAAPEAVSVFLQREFELVGKRQPPRRLDDGRWRFDFVRPGSRYQAFITADGDSVRIEHVEQTGRPVLVGFHVLHGYGGGTLYDVWAVFYDLACLALILFPLSGVYMWYTLTQRRWFGWACLGLSFGYAGATLLYLTFMP